MLDALTLDQLRVLAAIAETGSFTAAARRLKRAQSAISHAVATLEGELQLSLFDRSERKPRLTEAGLTVLADARLAIARIEQLKTRAHEPAKRRRQFLPQKAPRQHLGMPRGNAQEDERKAAAALKQLPQGGFRLQFRRQGHERAS